MNSRERMDAAMRLRQPDRVPVMCQLSLGHYFLHAGIDPVEIWHSTEGFAEALLRLQQRYGFDGVLINLPGRPPHWRQLIQKIERRNGSRVITWKNGSYTVLPDDDNPHVYQPDGTRYFPRFEELDPDKLFYVEPHDLGGLSYPWRWSFAEELAMPGPDFFPPWHFDTIRYIARRAGDSLSVHAEIFSPFSQFLELLDYTNALLALLDDPGKTRACLEALSRGAIELACGQVAAGAHAILISSAFAGAGFISRHHYEEFVLPFERQVIAGIRARCDVPVYTHTCGLIGDRLDLLAATGTSGIDTLDPPPIGNVLLADAKRQVGSRLFLKGNLDPVNTLLAATPDAVRAAARACIRDAAAGGGYILSSACSVAPRTPPENLLVLREAAETFGVYPLKE